MKIKISSCAVAACLFPVVMLTLTGCWTPPNANVQPAGEPRLIQGGIPVESIKDHATVQAVDAGQSSISLKLSDGTLVTCIVSPQVKNFDKVKAGDKVKVTLAEELIVYVLKDGRLANETIHTIAKVQSVDPSYRLLTLQYSDGKTETFKVGLDAKVLEMAPGDDVVARVTEARAIRIEKE
jgi:translation initiation factor IF-1